MTSEYRAISPAAVAHSISDDPACVDELALQRSEACSSDKTRTSRPLEIVIVHAADQGRGAEHAVLTLHRTLLRLGHRSRLLVGSKETNEPTAIEIERKRSIPGVLRLTRWLENRIGLQNLYAPWFQALDAQIGTADVLHINTLWGGTYGYADLTGLMRLTRRYPTVMTLHDGFMMTGHCACPFSCEGWKRGCGSCPDLKRTPAIARDVAALNWRRKFNAVQNSQMHVTAVSHWLKSQIQQSPIFSGKSVSVIHNSIDESIFRPASQAAARTALGLPGDGFLLLMAGQSIEGIHQGIAQQGVTALNRLANPGITPVLVGHSAARVAATITGPSIVRPFQSTPADMAEYYRAADVTLVCSEYETFGRVAAESLCCGTPVIAFATGGLTEIVEHDVTGWLVPTGDVDALAEQIALSYIHRYNLRSIGFQASRSATRRFSMMPIALQYTDIYEQTRQAFAAS